MILALDQSLTSTGYLVADCGDISDHGVIKTASEKKKRNIGDMDDKSRRTKYILKELHDLILDYKVRAIVCEEYSGYSQSKASADALATSRTIVVSLGYLIPLPVLYIPQMDAKYALTGNKNANKHEMCADAFSRYDEFEVYLSPRSRSGFSGAFEHVADALGIYLASRELEMVKMLESIR